MEVGLSSEAQSLKYDACRISSALTPQRSQLSEQLRMTPPTLQGHAPFPQHPDKHCPQRPILLAVDQQLGEGAALRVAPKLADPVGSKSGSIRTWTS